MVSGGATAITEYYRKLFHTLEAAGKWVEELDNESHTKALEAAGDASKWASFLHGCENDGGVAALRALAARARDGDASMEEVTTTDATAATVRRVLLLTAAHSLSQDGYDSKYMPEQGLLGVAPAGSKALEEVALTRARAPTYALAGIGPRKRPRADTDLLWPADASTALEAPTKDVDVLPIFGNSTDEEETKESSSFAQLLGSSNPVLRSVRSRHRILRLRAAAMQREADHPPTPPPPPPPPLTIDTSPAPTSTRIACLGRAAAALVLEHAGYTHASSRSLDVLVDAATTLVRRAATRLVAARERLDPDDPPLSRSALAHAALTDIRGGTAALQSYATYEARKAAAELAAAEERLTARGARAPTQPHPPVPDKKDASAKLNAATWSFGVLPDGAQLNVLGMQDPPPRSMACAVMQVPDPDADKK